MLHQLLKFSEQPALTRMLSLAEFKPSAGRILLSRRRPQISGLAEFKPKLLLSRPEIISKPAWGSNSDYSKPPDVDRARPVYGPPN